ncbi:MAG: tyrosine-type recombinase/integrase [Fimbriimonadaceae bacterium]
MRRPPGSGCKIERGGRTYYRVTVTLTDEYGRKKLKGFERRTLAEAQNAARMFLAQHGRAFRSEPAGTLADLFEHVDNALWSQAGDAHRRSMNLFRRKWEAIIGHVALDDLDPPFLTRSLGAMTSGRSRSVITKAAICIRQALGYAVSDLGWLKTNPAELMRLPKSTATPKSYPPMTGGEYRRLLDLADAKCRLMLRLIGECGMRPSEAARVRPNDLITANDRWLVRIPKSKTAAGVRVVPISDQLAREIEERAGKGWEGVDDPAEHLRKWWRKHSATRLYDLRGWCADEWRRQGVPDQVRSWLLGHTNPRFTQTVYETLTAEDTLKLFQR